MPHNREALLDELRYFPDRVARIVEPLSEETLCRAGAGGEWGAVEILAFLHDWDEVTLERIQQILNEDNPVLETYDYHAQHPHQTLAEFRKLRAELVAALEVLSDDAWHRTARHPQAGEITLKDLIHQVAENDQAQMQALKDVLS